MTLLINQNPKSQKGFTLIETIIVLAILSGAVLVIGIFTLNVSNFQIFLGKSLATDEEAQQTFKIMIPEIRSIGPSNLGNYPIASASSSSFSFYSDIDNDGIFEQVRYFLDEGVFKKGVVKPSGNPLVYSSANEKINDFVHNITSSNIFTYYDGDYSGTSLPMQYPINVSNIRLVKITLTIDDDPKSLPSPLILSILVNIRNLRGI